MAKTVFTGWRSVTPGKCRVCGSDDDWDCDGRGAVFCGCQCCPECGEHDDHTHCCPEAQESDEDGGGEPCDGYDCAVDGLT